MYTLWHDDHNQSAHLPPQLSFSSDSYCTSHANATFRHSELLLLKGVCRAEYNVLNHDRACKLTKYSLLSYREQTDKKDGKAKAFSRECLTRNRWLQWEGPIGQGVLTGILLCVGDYMIFNGHWDAKLIHLSCTNHFSHLAFNKQENTRYLLLTASKTENWKEKCDLETAPGEL